MIMVINSKSKSITVNFRLLLLLDSEDTLISPLQEQIFKIIS